MSTTTQNDTATGVEPRANELIETVQEVHRTIDRTPSPFDFEQYSDEDADEVYEHFEMWDLFLHRAGIITYTTVGEWVPTEVLLEAIIEGAEHTEDGNPTLISITENTPFTRSQYESRFGSWANAKEAAWIPAVNPSREAILSQIERLADTMEDTPTIEDLRNHGIVPYRAVKQEFGSWNAAVTAAGFTPNTNAVTEELLQEDYNRIANRPDMPDTPTAEHVSDHTVFSMDAYDKVFDGVPNQS